MGPKRQYVEHTQPDAMSPNEILGHSCAKQVYTTEIFAKGNTGSLQRDAMPPNERLQNTTFLQKDNVEHTTRCDATLLDIGTV